MADFTIRSDSVDVEQIMRQIRMRIKEKRGVDYTEDEVRDLASVKLEKFLNPRAVRSELVEHYRRGQRVPLPLPTPDPPPKNPTFDAETIYETHRAPLRWARRILNPILKLLFNPNPLIQTLHLQGRMNEYLVEQQHKPLDVISQRFVVRDELDALNFEVLNNIVLELTRVSIEVKNLKMRIESMNARQEFAERRARAVEGMVPTPAPAAAGAAGGKEAGGPEEEEGEGRTRRRRRRRGRRRFDGDQQGPTGGDARRAEGSAGSTDASPSSPASAQGQMADAQPTPPPTSSEPGSDQ